MVISGLSHNGLGGNIRPLSTPLFMAAVAVFITATGNYRFFHELTQVYPIKAANIAFLASLAAVVFFAVLLVIALLTLLMPLRLAAGFMLLVAAVVGHFSDRFGTIIDTEMIRNLLQTDPGEAADLTSPAFLLRLVLLGMLPCVLVAIVPLKPRAWLGRRLVAAALAGVALAGGAASAMTFSADYAIFLREHKPLRFYINPLSALVSASVYAKQVCFPRQARPFQHIATDAAIEEDDDGRELVIMVVGETARADRFALNGYARQTNPELSQLDGVISFPAVSSCGTSTAVSVPCMFSIDHREQFQLQNEGQQENVLDVLQRLGVSVLWRDNNSSSKGVAKRVEYQDFRHPDVNPVCDEECRDVGMLAGLQDYVDQQQGDILIVLHQMGNHGPAYAKRYPPTFTFFQPACQNSDLAKCSAAEINNAYDNAIRYTDHFLAEVIRFLQANTPRFETAMLYVSDHGESLGEGGLYLHGAPYFMAPEAQIHVPVIFWRGATLQVDLANTIRHKNLQNSHDAVFTSLLELFEVNSAALTSQRAFFELDQGQRPRDG